MPLEKEMATHSSILAWEIRWTEEPGGLQFTGLQKSQTWLSSSTPTTYKLQRKHWRNTQFLPGDSGKATKRVGFELRLKDGHLLHLCDMSDLVSVGLSVETRGSGLRILLQRLISIPWPLFEPHYSSASVHLSLSGIPVSGVSVVHK